MKNIKVFQIGCGKMAKYTMRYAIEKGYTIVGADDINSGVIGLDIGDIIEGNKTGIIIGDVANLEEHLKELKPDIAIVTTMSLIADCEDALMMCAKLGVSAITTCEEAFFPEVSNPKITEKLDKLAKENNCTITGSGYQDVFWGNLIYTIAGATHKITKIKGSSSYNVEDYGIALAQAHGAGLSLDEFEKTIAAADNISDNERNKLIEDGKFLPSYMWNVVPWLAERFNFKITSMNQKCIPMISEKEIHSKTLNIDIKAGFATGMSAIVTAETEEGITIEAECIGKVYDENEVDRNEWTVFGEPNTTVVISEPQTVELTCASVINRIPDVLNTISGYIPTCYLGELEYQKDLRKKS